MATILSDLPSDPAPRDAHDRMVRCRKWSDLLRMETAGARLAALACELEQNLERSAEVSAAIAQSRRYCAALRAEIAELVDRARSELFLARYFSRGHTYDVDALREEARLCLEEARSCEDGELHREFARSAFDLAMIGEAVARIKDGSEE